MNLFWKFPRPDRLYRALKGIQTFKARFTVGDGLPKLVQANGKIHLNSNVSGFPSAAFFKPLEIQAKRALGEPAGYLESLALVQVALTKKCPLNCEHCFEGDILNQKDTLGIEDHKSILDKLIHAKVPMVHYAGGEPMVNVNTLISLLNYGKNQIDFSIYTSGYKMTHDNALMLKKAGLSGVFLSIDHHDADKHNTFRRNDKAFQWAMEAAKNVRNADMVLTFTLCVTKAICNRVDLLAYMEMASSMDASFVMFLEPRALGNYENQNVQLNSQEQELLSQFFIEMNTHKTYAHLPFLVYPAHQQRTSGCMGAGSMVIYIDTDGFIHACPYCRSKSVHILGDDHEKAISKLQLEGCAN